MPFLKVEGLCKSFGGLKAVHNVTFDVAEGEIIGLIGPNGSGKTTTLNLLTGFLKPDLARSSSEGRTSTGFHVIRCARRASPELSSWSNPFSISRPCKM